MCLKTANVIIFSLVQHLVVCGNIPPPPTSDQINVRKCCPNHYYLNHVSDCVEEHIDNNTVPWTPRFSDTTRRKTANVYYGFIFDGIPNCRSMDPWPVYDDEKSCDKLILLADGTLRHYTLDPQDSTFQCKDEVTEETRYQDYNISDYCIDRVSHQRTILGSYKLALADIKINHFLTRRFACTCQFFSRAPIYYKIFRL